MINPLEYFATLVQQQEDIPLFEAALSIAQDDDPQLDLGALDAEFDRLGARLRKRLPGESTSIQKLRLLNHYFYVELGFAGNVNDYYDPDNSYLPKVLASRRGIPISLAVIYMELGRAIGLDVKGVAFPGHFLMKLTVESGDIVIDPFNGTSLSREDLEERIEGFRSQGMAPGDMPLSGFLRPAVPRDILVRMLRNLKALFTEQPDWQRVLEVQQRLVLLLPGDTTELRDRGQAYTQLECPQAAAADFEAYLDEFPDAPDARELQARLVDLRKAARKLN